MSCFQPNFEDHAIMDPSIVQSVKNHEEKITANDEKVLEIGKRIEDVKSLVESLRTLSEETKNHSDVLEHKLEDQ
jgi:hypothetical protein